MVEALCKELELQIDFLGNDIVRTIYFGGGTTSLLEDHHMKKLIKSFITITT